MADVKEITVQDCEELLGMFMKYTETAEQYEFSHLAMVYFKLKKPWLRFVQRGSSMIREMLARCFV